MNTTTIYLSSLNEGENYTFLKQHLEDVTEVYINISDLLEIYMPLFFKVDWGDGDIEVYQNDLYKDYRIDDISSEVLFGKVSNLFGKKFSHKYKPSPTSEFNNLTAVATMSYPNGSNVFTIPIEIRTYTYSEVVGDMKLKNTIIKDNGDKEHQLITSIGGNLVELKTSTK